MMSRKHYRALAAALAAAREDARTIIGDDTDGREGADTALRVAALKVADVLADDNPRFSRERFIHAVEGR